MARIRLRNNRDDIFNPLGTTLLSISRILARFLTEHILIIRNLESKLHKHYIFSFINLPSFKDRDKKVAN